MSPASNSPHQASAANASEAALSGLSGQQLLDDLRDIEVIDPGATTPRRSQGHQGLSLVMRSVNLEIHGRKCCDRVEGARRI